MAMYLICSLYRSYWILKKNFLLLVSSRVQLWRAIICSVFLLTEVGMHLTQVRVQSFLAFLIQPYSTWFRAYQGPENALSISGSNLSCRNHRTSRAPVSLFLKTTLVVCFQWKITNNGFPFNLVTAGCCYVFSWANMDHFRFFFMVALISLKAWENSRNFATLVSPWNASEKRAQKFHTDDASLPRSG